MKQYKMNLRLFDDGGGAGAAGAAGTQTGAGNAAQTGAAGATGAAEGKDAGEKRDFHAEFDQLVKGEYKDAFQKKMQQAMAESRKSSKQTEARLKEAEGLLALMGERYHLDGKDLGKLKAALEGDRKYLEEEALAKGMTIDQLAEFKKMERENRAFQEQISQERERLEFERKFAGWQREAEGLQAKFPELDLMQEFENKDFVRMLDHGISVEAAYQATHFDELMGGALQHTAAQTQKKVLDGIKARGLRPEENGTKGGGAGREKLDVTKLTREQRQELIERARKNPEEKISFV